MNNMQPRDARSDFPGQLICTRTRVTGVYQRDSNTKISITTRNGLTLEVDMTRFNIDSVRDMVGKNVFIQYTNNKGYKMICDVLKC